MIERLEKRIDIYYFKKVNNKIICSNCKNEQDYESGMLSFKVQCNNCKKKNKVVKKNIYYSTFVNYKKDSYYYEYENGKKNYVHVRKVRKNITWIKNISRNMNSNYYYDHFIKDFQKKSYSNYYGNDEYIYGGKEKHLHELFSTKGDYKKYKIFENKILNKNKYMQKKDIMYLFEKNHKVLSKKKYHELEKIFKHSNIKNYKNKAIEYLILDDYNILEKFNKQEIVFIEQRHIHIDLRLLKAFEKLRKCNIDKIRNYATKLEYDEYNKKIDELNYIDIIYDQFEIKYFKNCEEIKKQAKVLKNCIGGYCDKYANKETKIGYIKFKDYDKPLIHFEIKNGEIKQFSGYSNVEPTSKKWDIIKRRILDAEI